MLKVIALVCTVFLGWTIPALAYTQAELQNIATEQMESGDCSIESLQEKINEKRILLVDNIKRQSILLNKRDELISIELNRLSNELFNVVPTLIANDSADEIVDYALESKILLKGVAKFILRSYELVDSAYSIYQSIGNVYELGSLGREIRTNSREFMYLRDEMNNIGNALKDALRNREERVALLERSGVELKRGWYADKKTCSPNKEFTFDGSYSFDNSQKVEIRGKDFTISGNSIGANSENCNITYSQVEYVNKNSIKMFYRTGCKSENNYEGEISMNNEDSSIKYNICIRSIMPVRYDSCMIKASGEAKKLAP